MTTDFSFKPTTGALPGKEFERQVTAHLITAASTADWNKVKNKPENLDAKFGDLDRLAAQNPAGRDSGQAEWSNPVGYQRNVQRWRSSATCLFPPAQITSVMDTDSYMAVDHPPFDINRLENWVDPTLADPAARYGLDCFIHALVKDGGTDCQFILAATPVLPHVAPNRLIGGFHCLCADVGNITDHPLTGLKAGDILPMSLWDLWHRPTCSPTGMVFDPRAQTWVDIYLSSENGEGVFGGTATATASWYEFTAMMARRGKKLLTHTAFTTVMSGSTSGKSVTSPKTAGGNKDSTGRRIITDIGVEDGTRVLWHYLDEQGRAAGGSWNSTDGGPSARSNDPGIQAGGRGCAFPKWS